jgi:N-sulfoglucosamine sulfohydrolase
MALGSLWIRIWLSLWLSQSWVLAEDRCHILLLLSDDHSYPFVSAYGDTNVKTPRLDQLAADGMRFHRFFTAAPQCVPSRAALMTGRSPVAARITRFSSPLAKDEVTLPEILRKEARYYTGVCGRHFHLDGSSGKDPNVEAIYERLGLKTFAKRVDYLKNCGDNAVADGVEEFLAAKPNDQPFFMWANFSDPHHVWTTGRDLRPDPAMLKLPAHWPDLPAMREQLADYCAEVNHLDQMIGRVLDVLAKRQLMEKTMIVFCGDNGAAFPHGKGSLYDPGSNVPLIVHWPQKIAPGRESHFLLSGEDIAPTLLAAAGCQIPARMSGVSFLSLLRGETHQPRPHVFIERGPHGSVPVTADMNSGGYDLSRAVRSDRFKFIYNCTPWIPYSPVDSSGGAAWQAIQTAHAGKTLSAPLSTAFFTRPRPVYELYDLESDPSELKNISGEASHAATERELRLALAEKMISDFDYLPLPALLQTEPPSAKNGRSTAFTRLDQNDDGRLSRAEFISGQTNAAEGHNRFARRDQDGDEFLSQAEFLPAELPAPRK